MMRLRFRSDKSLQVCAYTCLVSNRDFGTLAVSRILKVSYPDFYGWPVDFINKI